MNNFMEANNEVVTDVGANTTNGNDSSYNPYGRGNISGMSRPFCPYRPPPPFLQRIYEMMENPETDSVVSWSSTGASFIIWDTHSFSVNVLPMYFNCNFQSFVCQLNSYGFSKMSWDRWEYKNEYFKKGEPSLMVNIKRRQKMEPPTSELATTSYAPISEPERALEILTTEYELLKIELANLKSTQVSLEERLSSLRSHVASNEERMITLAAQRVALDDDEGELSEMSVKGKRKFEEISEGITCCQLDDEKQKDSNEISIEKAVKLIAERFNRDGKMVLEEEEEASPLISLENLVGESSDWVEFIKEMKEKANHLKA